MDMIIRFKRLYPFETVMSYPFQKDPFETVDSNCFKRLILSNKMLFVAVSCTTPVAFFCDLWQFVFVIISVRIYSRMTTNNKSKSNPYSQQHQSSKFGIQHFFQCHSHSQDNPNPNPNPNPQSPNPINDSIQNPQPVDDVIHVSPEICKSLSLKPRFNFSPGMSIKQSQDDGGDEITWKISPVNDKLQVVSKDIINQLLNDSSSSSPANIRQLSLHKNSLALSSANGFACKTPQDLDFQDTLPHINTQHSPFRTPPSLPSCHDKLANDVKCNGSPDHLGQHKKASLQLLDQV
ncbi:hypothetical protein CFOL_v3_29016 [Cephalotus follicularis]|uniref:Uncharacterized protein n=1 Tax=Cephalotus follicularis TaxID=3775 RepID=A0A1Q3CZC0_CEPFO|nr:hypothetical protein CFOL_v3_29016 [Cephalotus follicularis]